MLLLATVNELALMIARAEDRASAQNTARQAVDKQLERPLGVDVST